MRAAVFTLLLTGCACSGPPKKAPIEALPVAVYTDCSRPGVADVLRALPDACLFVEIGLADSGTLRQWPLCGAALCEASQGHGFPPVDGQTPVPVSTYCLAPSAQAVSITVCIPSFEPLVASATPQTAAQGLEAALECPGRKSDLYTFKQQVHWYRLQPLDGGAADAGCPAAPPQWTRQLGCCQEAP